jgi:excisionase family DNA binding protein
MDTQGELLTIDELAAWLKVPKSWCYRATAARTIPFVRVGRHVRFERAAIQAWLAGSSGASRGPDAPGNADSRAVGRSRSDSFEKARVVGTHASNGHVRTSGELPEGGI